MPIFSLSLYPLIPVRPSRVNRRSATHVALVVSVVLAAVQRVPGSVLTAVPTAVRIVLLDDRRLLLDDLRKRRRRRRRRINEFSWQLKITSNSPLTSVLAQLQLIAVHRKMFISNMIRKSTANAMHTQSNQDGRMPLSSQIAETTERQIEE